MPEIRWRAGATAAALILVAGFFLAPAILAGGDFGPMTDGHLVEAAFLTELVASWRSTDQDMTAGLVHLVDYWRRYHAIKIAIATALLAVLVALATSCLRRNGAAVAAVVVAFALFAVLLVVVNIQATTAPLAALLQGLPMPDSTGTAQVYLEIRQSLATHRSAPILQAMIDSVNRYHAVMSVETALLAAVFTACAVWAWKAAHRPRAWAWAMTSALAGAGMMAVAVVTARMSLAAATLLPAYFTGVGG